MNTWIVIFIAVATSFITLPIVLAAMYYAVWILAYAIGLAGQIFRLLIKPITGQVERNDFECLDHRLRAYNEQHSHTQPPTSRPPSDMKQ